MSKKKSKRERAQEVIQPFLEDWQQHTPDPHEAFRDWAVEQILWDDMLSTSEIVDSTACDGPDDKGIDAWHIRKEDAGSRTVVLAQAKDTQPAPADVNKLIDGFVSLFDLNGNERKTANQEIFQLADNVDQLLADESLSIDVECWLLTSFVAQPTVRSRAENLEASKGKVVLHGREVTVRYYVRDVVDLSEDIRVLHNVPINEDIELTNNAFFQYDTKNHTRTITATVSGIVLARIFDKERTNLFRLNPRYYQGTTTKHNKSILRTLTTPADRANFYLYNNGVTILSDAASISPHPSNSKKSLLHLMNMQIVNGCQTTATLHHAWTRAHVPVDEVEVPIRVIEQSGVIAPLIAKATNTQNPMRSEDFRSNEAIHLRLQQDFMKLPSPWFYEFKRGVWKSEYKRAADKAPFRDNVFGIRKIAMKDLAQAAYAFLGHPREAVDRAAEIFDEDEIYGQVFPSSITAPQLLLPYVIYLVADEHAAKRKQAGTEWATYLRYPACYLISHGISSLAGKAPNAYFTRASSMKLVESIHDWKDELLNLAYSELEKEMNSLIQDGSGARSVVRTDWLPNAVHSFDNRLKERLADQLEMSKQLAADTGQPKKPFGLRSKFPLPING